MTIERIELLLSSARHARRTGNGSLALEALQSAWALAQSIVDQPLTVRVAWKLAKAHADFGDPCEVIRCLDPVVGRADLFSAYPQGVVGATRAARSHQDRYGFSDSTVRGLWRALAEHHKESGDPLQAAQAQLQLAWDSACRGEGVDEALGPVLRLTHAELEGGSSRHPRAIDAPSSLAWLHVDAAHTAIRAAVWIGDAEEAAAAADDLRYAVAELPESPGAHVQHALLEAAHHGYIEPPKVLEVHGSKFDRAFAQALMEGSGFPEVAELASGPEWRLSALLCGVRTGEVEVDLVVELAEKYGCRAFLQAIDKRS